MTIESPELEGPALTDISDSEVTPNSAPVVLTAPTEPETPTEPEETTESTEPVEMPASIKSVAAWQWVDELEIIDLELNVAPIPSISADNPIDLETLIGFLPQSVTATVEDAGETLALTWACETFPEVGAMFIASLPEGYALAEDAAPLTLTVDLGGAEYQIETDGEGYYMITDAATFNEFANLANTSNSYSS